MIRLTERVIIEEITCAFEDLTVLARLEFAKNLICKRNGEPGDASFDPFLATAEELLSGVIKVLRTVPKVGALRLPEP